MPDRYAICVYCASVEDIDPALKVLARDVGTALAGAGITVVSGGGKVSCMGAVARGARDAGGRTEGVITRFLVDLEVADTDADELVVTDTMRERKAEMDCRSDGFLILPGGLGTLEELFEIWTTRSLGEHHRPLVVLDPTRVFEPLLGAVRGLVTAGLVRAAAYDALTVVRDIPAALAALTVGRTAVP